MMTVGKASTVDAIGVEKATGTVVLTVSDHLDWSAIREHLSVLQVKLNSYLAFIESGQILTDYPDASGRTCRIDVVFRVPPPPPAQEFLKNVKSTTTAAGVDLAWRVLETVNDSEDR